MNTPFFFAVLVVLPSYGFTKYLEKGVLVQPGSDSIHDDIRLTPEQKLMKRERGFYTAAKWPLKNNIVTVPFYIDSSIPAGEAVRDVLKDAIREYESQTCIRWVETTENDPRDKIKVFKGQGCYSYVGNVGQGELSLGNGCAYIGTAIHEMGHAMGLYHTQSRPDRDNYVKIWLQNVQPGMEGNFDVSEGDLYDVPYDYASMMHYGSDYFSVNGSYTLTTIDPFALYAIGGRPTSFRWSDAAFLNRAYTCDKIFAAGCPGRTCSNGGYVGGDCVCKCPENTSGQRCETVTGPIFSEIPKCGGTITKEGDIMSQGFGTSSTTDKCIFKIVAPNCKLPSITITQAKFVAPYCYYNRLAIQISKEYFGPSYCDHANIPIGKPFVSDDSTAVVYFNQAVDGMKDVGFKGNVKFVDNPSCGKPTTTPTTTRAPITTTTPLPVSGGCVLTNYGTTNFQYNSPGFPKRVAPNMVCQIVKNPSPNTNVFFNKVRLQYYLGSSDQISLSDRLQQRSFIGLSSSRTFYALWPITIKYSTGSSPGEGFSAQYTTVSGLPNPCNGQTVKMVKGDMRIFKNPLVGFAESKASCAFKIEAQPGVRLAVQGTSVGIAVDESLHFTPNLPIQDSLVRITTTEMRTQQNVAIFYYVGGEKYSSWEFKVTAV